MSEEEIVNLKVMVSNLDLSIDSKEKLYNQISKISFLLQQKENIIKDIEDYINFLVIFNQTISGKFSETQWGQDLLGFIGSDK